jgi:hypothetical protein
MEITIVPGNPVQFARFPEAGVPNTGVTKVGLVVPAKVPVPDCPLSVVFTALLVVILYILIQ